MAGKLLSGSIDLLSMCNSGSVRSFWNFWLMQWVASKRYRRVLKFIIKFTLIRQPVIISTLTHLQLHTI